MRPHWRYRLAVTGVAVCSIALVVVVANHPVSQRLFTSLPLGSQLTPVVLSGDPFWRTMVVTMTVMLAAFAPLFVRPRRVFDVITLSGRQVAIGCLVLAAIGYFDYTFRLPRTTFTLTSVLLCLLPAVFVGINDRFLATTERTVVIGNSRERIERVLDGTDVSIAGYVSPPDQQDGTTDAPRTPVPLTDGGNARVIRPDGFRYLGSLSRLSAVLRNYDVSRAILVFSAPSRSEFFGTLAVCYSHGVSVTVDHGCADSVLSKRRHGEFVDVDLDPWDWKSHAVKYLFDRGFALVGLLASIPLLVVIAIAIKLDSAGPVFYTQDRTTVFGRTFRLYKFRTMAPDSEDTAPIDDGENKHITRVGRFLRRTHIDEIPQLFSILVGDMSVVGPRAAWVEEEEQLMEARNERWRKRWFVKPGLTGLAQVHDVSSTNPELKLQYDLEYIRRQSFSLDVKLVARQIRMVLADSETVVSALLER